MEIQTAELLPQNSASGFIMKQEIRGNNLYVWYKKPQGGKLVEFSFPKRLNVDPIFIQNLALCIGDGLNNPSKRNTHCNFANNNLDLVKLVFEWWLRLGVSKEKIFVYTCAGKSKDLELAKRSAEKILGCKNVRGYLLSRHKYPTNIIQVGNSIFQSFYLNLFQNLQHIIIANRDLCRAFLSGLFAAEGHVKHSTYGTIESISYSFNPKTEKDLAEFTVKCLLKEGISAKISTGQLYFCGYEQMLQFYILGLAKLHRQKEEKFRKLCLKADITLHFKPGFLQNLEFVQQQLARQLGCSQSSLSLDIKHNRFNFRRLRLAFPRITISEILQNVDFAHVRTSKISDSKAIAFLINLQSSEIK